MNTLLENGRVYSGQQGRQVVGIAFLLRNLPTDHVTCAGHMMRGTIGGVLLEWCHFGEVDSSLTKCKYIQHPSTLPATTKMYRIMSV